jgi:hypothetical protein
MKPWEESLPRFVYEQDRVLAKRSSGIAGGYNARDL